MAAAVAYVGAEDADALDCGVCYQPLKPPIFQCKVGHMVCSMCRDKLKTKHKCYVCGIRTEGYSRCHGMERLVECIRVRCPNAAHGCTIRPIYYYDQHRHRQTCPHMPCHCPGEACIFAGSTSALLDHVASVHGWRTTKIMVGDRCTVRLRDGFNFLLAYCASDQCLLLVNVARQPLDRVISVICINPLATADAKEMECSLSYSKSYSQSDLSYSKNNSSSHPQNYLDVIKLLLLRAITIYTGGDSLPPGDLIFSHFQSSTFRVACTNLSNGLPNPDEGFRFVVPNSIAREYAIKVEARIIIK